SIIIHNTRTTPFSTLSLHDALPILWRDEFEKKKVKLPTTFEEAKQAAHALNRPKENFYGLGQSWNRTADGYGVMQSLMYSYGASWATKEGKYRSIKTPAMQTVMRWATDIY